MKIFLFCAWLCLFSLVLGFRLGKMTTRPQTLDMATYPESPLNRQGGDRGWTTVEFGASTVYVNRLGDTTFETSLHGEQPAWGEPAPPKPATVTYQPCNGVREGDFCVESTAVPSEKEK